MPLGAWGHHAEEAQGPEGGPLLGLIKEPFPNCPISTRSLKMNIHKIRQEQQNTASFTTINTLENFIIL